jgi:hypothetical protein
VIVRVSGMEMVEIPSASMDLWVSPTD